MLKKIDYDINLKRELNKPLDPRLIFVKPDKAKSKYITGQTVIDLLNLTFGHFGWTWEVKEQWVQESIDKVIKTKWIDGRKVDLEEPILEPQQPVAHTRGRLTVFLKDEDEKVVEIFKDAAGAQPVNGGQGEQEHIFKGSSTDALKKAATMFGIGLEMYRKESEPNWFEEISYVNPWDDETTAEYQDQWDIINGYIVSTEITMDSFLVMLQEYAGSPVNITPETIVGISEMILSLDNKE